MPSPICLILLYQVPLSGAGVIDVAAFGWVGAGRDGFDTGRGLGGDAGSIDRPLRPDVQETCDLAGAHGYLSRGESVDGDERRVTWVDHDGHGSCRVDVDVCDLADVVRAARGG